MFLRRRFGNVTFHDCFVLVSFKDHVRNQKYGLNQATIFFWEAKVVSNYIEKYHNPYSINL